MDNDHLHEVLTFDRYGEHDAQEAIAGALEKLLVSAGEERLKVRGKYRANRDDDAAKLDTTPIEPIKFADFRQFSYLENELRHGHGLLSWRDESGQIFHDVFGSKRKDGFTHVTVNRADLLREFPAIPPKQDDRENIRSAETFDRADPVALTPWWSANQALAWIVSRIPSYVEHVGRMERDGSTEKRSIFVHFIMEHDLAGSDEGKAYSGATPGEWPNSNFLHKASLELLASVQNRRIRPVTRDAGKGREMLWPEFVGIGTAETASDWLDLDPQPLFSSAEVIAAFQCPEPETVENGRRKVPANRQLNHEKIIERAGNMRKEKRGISLGSAAASIRAELPPNPKTGRPRDQRGIEKIIAHLWEGKVTQSPK